MDLWVLIFIVCLSVVAVIALSLFLWRKRPPKYHSLFIVGIIWLLLGISYILIYFFREDTKLIALIGIGIPIFAVGLFFLIISLVNKDKWKTQELEGKYSEVMEILYKRYARGEISREEYTQIKEGISRQEE